MITETKNGVHLIQLPDGRKVLVNHTRGGFYPLRVQNHLNPSASDRVVDNPVMCSCTGKTAKTATPLVAGEVGAVCPECGKTLQYLKTPADFRAEEEERVRRAREDLRLVMVGRTDFGTAYRLTARIDRSEWAKIARYMRYVTTRDEAGMDADDYDFGWVTFSPGKVEDALGITGDLTVVGQREAAQRRRNDPALVRERAILARVKEIGKEIRRLGEMPEGDNSPIGERLFDTQNIYGGGDWFVAGPEYLWYVVNNGMDGDNWSYNNVRTGGAGAIGYRVPATSPLAEEIRRLANEIGGK